MHKNNYRSMKSAVRQMAIDWQHSFGERSHSWEELVNANMVFEKLGKRYGLLTEFRENGILSAGFEHEHDRDDSRSAERFDYPIEYWIGWILAYYQWFTGKPFATICRKISYQSLEDLYKVLHEADPSKAVNIFDEMLRNGETNLARLRKNKQLSQSQLAKAAGISVRSIQLFEQKQTDISKAQYNHLKALSTVLGCTIEDLLN